ncbi:MAG: DUF4243 domain-containing protein [Myxococcales bacterium]|nr:DUF4243 domain-containing protein [Myxococcales bacterium]
MTSKQWERRKAIAALNGSGLSSGLECSAVLPEDATYDDALDLLHSYDPVMSKRLTNHTPMAVESLRHLQCDNRITDWVNDKVNSLTPMAPGKPMDQPTQQRQRGQLSRRADWIATFERALQDSPPKTVLVAHWPKLTDAMAAHAFHGLLRTSHAVRALRDKDTPARRRELAHGLGYWTAGAVVPAGIPGSKPERGFDIDAALAALTPVPKREQRHSGLVLDRLTHVFPRAAFIDVIERLDVSSGSALDQLGHLTRAAGRLFLSSKDSRFAFLHGITGSACLRELAPWLTDDELRVAVGRAFQVVAAMHMGLSAEPYSASQQPRSYEPSDVWTCAADTSDAHALKLAQAALGEHAANPDPVYLASSMAWFSNT